MKNWQKASCCFLCVMLVTALAGCAFVKTGDDAAKAGENESMDEAVFSGEKDTGNADHAQLSGNKSDEASGEVYELAGEAYEETDETFEYYLTMKEMLANIEEGYVFRLDQTFPEPVMPTVTGSHWYFDVHEDNTLKLEIAFSNLLERESEGAGIGGLFDQESVVSVKIISPEGKEVYSFEKKKEEITEDTAVSEEIRLTPGEWEMQLSFSFQSKGGEKPGNLKITACYENPSEQDIEWLKENRLLNNIYHPLTTNQTGNSYLMKGTIYLKNQRGLVKIAADTDRKIKIKGTLTQKTGEIELVYKNPDGEMITLAESREGTAQPVSIDTVLDLKAGEGEISFAGSDAVYDFELTLELADGVKFFIR